ncbi:MAG: hypothetical protein AAB074_15150 [Planctomycetota bacterium]
MHFRIAGTLFWSMTGLAALAQGETEVRIKMPKGARWTVAQVLEVQSENLDPKGKSEGRSKSQPDFRLAESWVDECVAEEDAKPLSIRRTVASSQVSVRSGKLLATGMDQAVIAIERKGADLKVVAGNPDEKSLAVLRLGPPEAVELLCPEKAVKTGATWDVPQEAVLRLLDALGASIPSLTGKDAENAKTEFAQGIGGGTRSFAEGVALHAKVASVRAGELKIELEGNREFEGMSSGSVNGKKPDVKNTIAIRGTFTVNAETGVPVSLDLTIVQVEYDGSRVVVGGKAPAIPGIRETWRLNRTYTVKK